MNAYVTNIARVVALTIVGAVAGLLAHANLHLGAPLTAAITLAVTGAVAGIMLKGLTMLERRFPWLTHLLPVKDAGVTGGNATGQATPGKS